MFKFEHEPKKILGTVGNLAKRKSDPLQNQKKKSTIVQNPKYEAFGDDKLVSGWNKIEEYDKYFKMNEPVFAPFIPLPSKIDKSTQIELIDWLLFDFENEVIPILQILVSKVIQQAKSEVIQEKEKKVLIEKKNALNLKTNAALAETQRLLDKNLRFQEEQKMRAKQNELFKIECISIQKKLCTFYLSKLNLGTYLRELNPFGLSKSEIVQYNQHLLTESFVEMNIFQNARMILDRSIKFDTSIKNLEHKILKKLVFHHFQVFDKKKAEIENAILEKEKTKIIKQQKIEYYNKRELEKHLYLTNLNIYKQTRKLFISHLKSIQIDDILKTKVLPFGYNALESEAKKLSIGLLYEPILYIILIMKKMFGDDFGPIIAGYFNSFFKLETSQVLIPIPEHVNEQILQINAALKLKPEEVDPFKIEQLSKTCADFLVENVPFPKNKLNLENVVVFYNVIFTNKFKSVFEETFIQSDKLNFENDKKLDELQAYEFRKNIKNVEFFVKNKFNESFESNRCFIRLQNQLSSKLLADFSEENLKVYQQKIKRYSFDGSIYNDKLMIFQKTNTIGPFYCTQINENKEFIYNKPIEKELVIKYSSPFREHGNYQDFNLAEFLNEIEDEFIMRLKEKNKDMLIFDYEL